MINRYLETYYPWFGDMLGLGGDILFIIIILAFLLWGLMFERLLFVFHALPQLSQQAKRCWLARSDQQSWFAQQYRRRLLAQIERESSRNLSLIRGLIKICPLLGLLGTVLGMLEVFDAVAALGSNNPRSTAGGVSKATISTMAGMVVAISGMLCMSFLTRKVSEMKHALSNKLVFEVNETK